MAKNEKKPAAQGDQVRKMGVAKKPKEVEETVEPLVAIDRRASRDRRQGDRRGVQVPVAVERRKLERREKVQRRRQIDPTTCERDYSGEELEFMNALALYKRTSGRMFPTCSEILEVLRNLGYEKRLPQTPVTENLVAAPVLASEAVIDVTAATMA